MRENGALLWNIKKLVSKGDYYYAVVPEHPNRTKNNYVLYHRIVMENYLGRILNKYEIVHHIDENKKNNDINNLQILTKSMHTKLHMSVKGEKFCELKCPNCFEVFNRPKRQTHLVKKKNKCTCCSKECRSEFWRKVQLNRLTTQQVESAISENILREYNSLDNPEGTHLQETP